MPDFNARITWSPPELSTSDMQEADLYTGHGEEKDLIGSSPLGHDTNEYLVGVDAETDYTVIVFAVVNSVRGPGLVIEFTTPANVLPVPTNGSVTFEPIE